MDRESGSWSSSGSAFGSETGSSSETHSASTGCVHAHDHTQTTRNQRERVVDRILSLPPLAGVPTNTSSSTEDVDVSSPSDDLCDTTSGPPSASASISALAFLSRMSTERRREYRQEYGPVYQLQRVFFMGLRTSADAGEREGKGSFQSSLSGSSFESILSQHSSQPQPPPQVEQPRPQPQPTEDGSTDTYLPPARP